MLIIKEMASKSEIQKTGLFYGYHAQNETGELLRMLVAAKPNGSFLEIGTGVGIALSWMAEGLTGKARIISLEIDPSIAALAQSFVIEKRVRIVNIDARDYLMGNPKSKFDLIFADASIGKFADLELTIRAVKQGGFLIFDDMKPVSTWPQWRQKGVRALRKKLGKDVRFFSTYLDVDTGLLILNKRV